MKRFQQTPQLPVLISSYNTIFQPKTTLTHCAFYSSTRKTQRQSSHTEMDSFSRLPFELRSYIWTLTIEPRRTVEVRTRIKDLCKFASVPDPELWGDLYFFSPMPVPAALHVCHESRSAIERQYERAFTHGAGERYIWVNFDLDIISIGETSLEQIDSEAPRIHELRFTRDNSEMEEYFFDDGHLLETFCSVKEIVVDSDAGPAEWHDFNKHNSWPCPKENLWFFDTTLGKMFSAAEYERLHDEMKLDEDLLGPE